LIPAAYGAATGRDIWTGKDISLLERGWDTVQIALSLVSLGESGELAGVGRAARVAKDAEQAGSKFQKVKDLYSRVRRSLKAQRRDELGCLGPGCGRAAAERDLRELLDGGQVSIARMKAFVPDGSKKEFVPSARIKAGEKYQFDLHGVP